MTCKKRLEIIKHKQIKEMKISDLRDWLYLDKYGNKQNSLNMSYISDLREFLEKGKYSDHLIFLNQIINNNE